jgi:type VI secretion system secreted protein Hcp
MAFDTFLKIDGIPGESTDSKHKDWIELLSFSHGLHQPASATASSAGGATAERVNHQDFNITKMLDKASPKIYEGCCTGKHLKDVTIEMCRAGGDKMKYMEIKLENVIISSVSTSGSSGGEFPSESISFNYGKIKWNYIQQKRADGSGGGNVPAGWSLEENKTYA